MNKSKLEALRSRHTKGGAFNFDDPTPRNGVSLLRGLGGPDIVGVDVAEVAPECELTTNAVQLPFEEFALMTVGRPA